MSRLTESIKTLLRELKRRKVLRACVVYVLACWGTLQVTEKISNFLEFDLGAVSPVLLAAAILGFPVAVIFSWFYQVSAKGVSRTPPFVERRVLNNLAPLEDRRKEASLPGSENQFEADYDWVLEMESGPLSGLRYGVEGKIVVGRAIECELTIPVPQISREHARFVIEGSQLLIEDLGSSNGTMVNGSKISNVVSLNHLDTVEILGIVIRIKESPAHAVAHANDTTVVDNAMIHQIAGALQTQWKPG